MSVSDVLPLFPLGTALMPGMDLPLHIFEERYRRMLIDQHGADPLFGVVMIRSGREVVDQPEIREIGTAASLTLSSRASSTIPTISTSFVVLPNRRPRAWPFSKYLAASVLLTTATFGAFSTS